jgi:hypothetical protein
MRADHEGRSQRQGGTDIAGSALAWHQTSGPADSRSAWCGCRWTVGSRSSRSVGARRQGIGERQLWSSCGHHGRPDWGGRAGGCTGGPAGKPTPRPRDSVTGGCCRLAPLVAVAAQELADFGLEGGLQEQAGLRRATSSRVSPSWRSSSDPPKRQSISARNCSVGDTRGQTRVWVLLLNS